MFGRFLIVLGGLAGAVGVALSALAAHMGGGFFATAAPILLAHAPALLAIGLAGRNRFLTLAGWIMAIGLVLFAGDLVLRQYGGERMFPMAAPAGGGALLIAWVMIALGGLWQRE